MEKQTQFLVEGMTCAACQANVTKAAEKLPGVTHVDVNLLSGTMKVDYDPDAVTPQTICEAVTRIGYNTTPKTAPASQSQTNTIQQEWEKRQEKMAAGQKDMKTRMWSSVLLLVPLLLVSMGPMMGLPILQGEQWAMVSALIQLILTTYILFIQRHFFIHGLKALVHKAPNMDSLVAIGAGAAYLYGLWVTFQMAYGLGIMDMHAAHLLHSLYYESAATIVTLVSVGKYLEARSKAKTGDALGKLVNLAPKTAVILKDGQEVTVNADTIQAGDIVIIKPGQTIPVDGIIRSGNGSVDQAAITGESIPVEKGPGDTVMTATTNTNGTFRFEATKVGSDTTLAKIIQLVDEAGSTKAPIARLADKVSGIFVPVVIAIALATFLIWLLLGKGFPFALSNAISVLVISCPCALGLATPVAIMVGTGKAAEYGILIKNAEALETLHAINTIVLDKTGTITSGKPVLKQILCEPGMDPDQLLQLAASVESGSEHPLAKAVVQAAKDKGLALYSPASFEAVGGRGIKAVLHGKSILAGNVNFLAENGIPLTDRTLSQVESLAAQGMTPLLFVQDKTIAGILGVADAIRQSSRQAIARFQAKGIQVIMLTGDNRQTAQAIAKDLHLDEVIADVLPAQKESVVRRLEEEGRKVAMVGDGINDAPALARADVGIAIGAGTDIAIDSADIVLMKDDLMDVNTVIELSHAVIRNIKTNLFWAFFYNILGIPVAAGLLYPAFGLLLNPMIGSGAMSLSSVCVVTNALTLRFFKPSENRLAGKPEEAAEEVIVYEPEEKKMEKTMKIEGMACAHCSARVTKALEAVPGVTGVTVSLENKEASISMDQNVSDEALMDAVKEAGYEPVSIQ